MGKTVEFRRHACKDGANRHLIGPIGHREARLIGERQLRGLQFTDFYVSRLFRTTQTLVSFAEGAKDMVLPGHFNPPVAPWNAAAENDRALAFWRHVGHQAEVAGEDLVTGCLYREPQLCAEIGRHAAVIFRKWLHELPDEARVLVVGHSPFMEFMIMDMFGGAIIPGLRFCDGLRIVERSRRLTVETPRDNPRLNAAGFREDLR
jgi:phosphohistidine phosphatase SixA